MQIMRIFQCENIRIQNFSVDWDHPFMYQGKYVNATDDYIDVALIGVNIRMLLKMVNFI